MRNAAVRRRTAAARGRSGAHQYMQDRAAWLCGVCQHPSSAVTGVARGRQN